MRISGEAAAGGSSITFIILLADGSPTCQRLLPPPPSRLNICPKIRQNVNLRQPASKNTKNVNNDPKEMNKFRFMGHLNDRSAHKAPPPPPTSGCPSAPVGPAAFIQNFKIIIRIFPLSSYRLNLKDFVFYAHKWQINM